MATVREYIEAKLKRYYIVLEDAEIDGMLADGGVSGDDTYTVELSDNVKRALVSFIPELLLMPAIAEGDFSRKWDIAGIKAYCSLLREELGMDDIITEVPKIVDKSSLW